MKRNWSNLMLPLLLFLLWSHEQPPLASPCKVYIVHILGNSSYSSGTMKKEEESLWTTACFVASSLRLRAVKSKYIPNLRHIGYSSAVLVLIIPTLALQERCSFPCASVSVCCGFHGGFLSSLCVKAESTWPIFLPRCQGSTYKPAWFPWDTFPVHI